MTCKKYLSLTLTAIACILLSSCASSHSPAEHSTTEIVKEEAVSTVYPTPTPAPFEARWVSNPDGWRYEYERNLFQTGWLKDGGHWYYLDKDGIMQTGWIKDKENWYYLNSSGALQTGWLELPDGRYYLKDSGAMTTGWAIVDGTACYFQENGLYNPAAAPAPTASVALTFDDGPGKDTWRLLDAFEKNNSHATFFVLGQQAAVYSDELRRMQALGCEVGNHTYNHKNLTKLTPQEKNTELLSNENLIASILRQEGALIRPPYGAVDDALRAFVSQPLIFWSIDTLDWKTKNAQATIDTVLSAVKDGDIILMHDIHSTSVDAAEVLIPELIVRGYELVTVSELAEKKGISLTAGKGYGAMR